MGILWQSGRRGAVDEVGSPTYWRARVRWADGGVRAIARAGGGAGEASHSRVSRSWWGGFGLDPIPPLGDPLTPPGLGSSAAPAPPATPHPPAAPPPPAVPDPARSSAARASSDVHRASAAAPVSASAAAITTAGSGPPPPPTPPSPPFMPPPPGAPSDPSGRKSEKSCNLSWRMKCAKLGGPLGCSGGKRGGEGRGACSD